MTTEQDNTKSVVIERLVDAPVELVWQMWTDADHFAAWYGPDGASVAVSTMDVRVGGRRHFRMEMTTPGGPMQMWFVGEYREVTAPSRLVFTESMCDPDGNILSPADMGMPADHPTTTDVIVELTAVDEGTKMIMTHVGVPADSPGAAGWNMALDKLAARVGALR
ncbi:MAG: SRPBCC domain-containing protein [Ilumatobacteraceae bacterium]